MHMADALISPAVAGTMYACTTAATAYSIRKVRLEDDPKKVPVMGVMGAFVFAGQMINFTIPGTGSSGHICGGLLLTALLGPQGAFLALAGVLAIQALLFADGGLLALGCNIWNIGFYSCFIGAALVWNPLMRGGFSRTKITIASVLGCVLTLQLGAFSVTLETLASGITELPFGVFVAAMQPIHLAIGLVEGLVTAAILIFVYEARPEMLHGYGERLSAAEGGSSAEEESTCKTGFARKKTMSFKAVLTVFAIAAVIVGGVLALFASENPDGLEWSMEKVAGTAELETSGGVYEAARAVQDASALLPDYGFKSAADGQSSAVGTGFSGIVGGAVVLGLSAAVAVLFRFFNGGRGKLKLQEGCAAADLTAKVAMTEEGRKRDEGHEGEEDEQV